MACEWEAATLPTFSQKCSKHCTQQALSEKTGGGAIRAGLHRKVRDTRKPTHKHTHIPTEAHIFRKTRSYSVILQSGTRGGMRSPASAIYIVDNQKCTWTNPPDSTPQLVSAVTWTSAENRKILRGIKRWSRVLEWKQDGWRTWLWSPTSLCSPCSHLEGPRSSCQLFFAPKLRGTRYSLWFFSFYFLLIV